MPKAIDWLYKRKSCVTCARADEFIGDATPVGETVDARKVRFDATAALGLLSGIDTLIAARGTKVVTFDLKKDRPDDTVLTAHLMGPSGNLRAPAARVGKTLLIGFNEDMYRTALGK